MACDLCNLLAEVKLNSGAALIWGDDRVSVVAVDEAEYPGFTRVVWNGHVKEMTDLPAADRVRIMDVVWAVESAQREVMAPEKVNLASFGNMTPHVHWHVIPRYRDDAHFPNPTWAVAQRASSAEVLAQRRVLLPALRAAIVEKVKAL